MDGSASAAGGGGEQAGSGARGLGRRTAAAAGIGLGVAAGFNIANVGAAAAVLSDEYAVRLGTIGFLTTALFSTHLVMQMPGGRLTDRLGSRRVGLAGLSAIVAGNAVALLAPAFAVAAAGRLLMGIGTGMAFVAGSDYVRATIGSTTAQGLYGGAGVGGGGLAIAIVPLAVGGLDWRAPYVTALVLCLAVLALLWAAPPDRHRDAARPAPTGLRTIVADRRLYPLALIHTASFSFSVIVGIWTVALLEGDGYSREVGGAVGALTLLGGLATRPLGGTLMQRWPARTPWLIRTSMLGGALGTVVLVLDAPLGLRIAGAALLGLAAGFPFAPAFSGAQALRRDAPGLAVGFVNSSATLTILVGAPLVGFSFALPGDGAVGFVTVALLWAAAALSSASPGRERLTGRGQAGLTREDGLEAG